MPIINTQPLLPATRTVASLLLTTSVWDNLEELFCRVSNEAFQFDELAQVAPIISARLYVNCEYHPLDIGAPISAPPLRAPSSPAGLNWLIRRHCYVGGRGRKFIIHTWLWAGRPGPIWAAPSSAAGRKQMAS